MQIESVEQYTPQLYEVGYKGDIPELKYRPCLCAACRCTYVDLVTHCVGVIGDFDPKFFQNPKKASTVLG